MRWLIKTLHPASAALETLYPTLESMAAHQSNSLPTLGLHEFSMASFFAFEQLHVRNKLFKSPNQTFIIIRGSSCSGTLLQPSSLGWKQAGRISATTQLQC